MKDPQDTSLHGNRMSPLDAWRGIAILGVLASHSLGTFLLSEQIPSSVIYRVLAQGYIGVNFFFAISGFLICFRLLEAEETTGSLSLSRFYLRRACRILPLFTVYILILLILTTVPGVSLDPDSLLASAFLIQNYALKAGEIHWLQGHLWSLCVEEHFYLVFPLALIIIGKDHLHRGITLFIIAILIGLWRSFDFHFHQFERLWSGINFFTRTDTCLDFLLWGALAAIVWKNRGRFVTSGKRCGLANEGGGVDVSATGNILYSWASYMRPAFSRRNINPTPLVGQTTPLPAGHKPASIFPPQFLKFIQRILPIGFIIIYLGVLYWEPPLSLLWQAVLFPMILVSTLECKTPGLDYLLKSKVLQWLGKISFSLYIWNNIFLVPVELNSIRVLDWAQTLPFNLALLLLLATLTYYLIEEPFIKLGKRMTERKNEA